MADKNLHGGTNEKPQPFYLKNGQQADPNDMKNQQAIPDWWMDELKRQREKKARGGDFHDSKKHKLMIAENAIGMAMEKAGAKKETIDTWIGKDKYTPPNEPDPELEKAWGKQLDEREKKKMEKAKKTILEAGE